MNVLDSTSMKLSTKTQIIAAVAVVGLTAARAAVASVRLYRSRAGAASGLAPGYVGARARGWSGAPQPPGAQI